MNWKNRLTNYNFWISIVSAVLLVCQAFKLEFDIAYINEIATAVFGLLVVIGIISDPTKIAIKEVQKVVKTEEKVEPKKDEETFLENKNETTEEVDNKEESKEEIVDGASFPIESEDENVGVNCEDDLQTAIEKSVEVQETSQKTMLVEADILNLIKEILKNENKVEEQNAESEDEKNLDEKAEGDEVSTNEDVKKDEIVFKIVND